MELYLVRHAQTTYNKLHRIQGSQIDSELNAEGMAQTEKIAERIKDIHFDLVLCSPMKRTRKTLEIILEKHISDQLGDVINFEDGLKERDWGSMTGELWKDVDFESLPIDAEKYEDFVGRIVATLEKHYVENTDSRVLIVTHGGVVIKLLEELFGQESPRVPNVSLTVFKFCVDGNHRLIMEPCNAHLED